MNGVAIHRGGGLTAGGSASGQVQYRSSSGGLSAEAALAYDETTNTLTVGSVILTGGSTHPTSPSEGQLWFDTATGRKVLKIYAGGQWNSIQSFGSMTLYVDGASGSDAVGKGTGTGSSAYATIQYAVNAIPGLVGGNVTINVAAGTYSESVVIRGKTLTGDYTIQLTGTMTTLDSLTASSGTQGSGATLGTIVRNSGTWTLNQRQNKWARFTSGNNNGTRMPIESNTAGNTLTICGYWPGTVTNGDTFVVEDQNTTVTAITVAGGQRGVNIKQFALNNANASVDVYQSGTVGTVDSCAFIHASSGFFWGSKIGADVAYYYSVFVKVRMACGGRTSIANNKFVRSQTGTAALYTTDAGGNVRFDALNVLDGESAGGGNIGFHADRSSVGMMGPTYNVVKNWVTGVLAEGGGIVLFTGNNQYSGNSANETATAASYGYID